MLSKDFKEFIELLNENDVKYLVVGGYAVALHGHLQSAGNLFDYGRPNYSSGFIQNS